MAERDGAHVPGDRLEIRIPLRFRMQPVDAQHPDWVAVARGPVVYVLDTFAHSQNFRLPDTDAELNKWLVADTPPGAFHVEFPGGGRVGSKMLPLSTPWVRSRPTKCTSTGKPCHSAFTEIGYYNYDITDFKAYMKTLKNPTNLSICPDGAKIVYNPATMAFVYNFLQYKADHVVYIYGELDAWSSTQMQLIGRTDAIKIVVQDSHHGARIGSFTPEQRDLFYSNMERWLQLKLARQ